MQDERQEKKAWGKPTLERLNPEVAFLKLQEAAAKGNAEAERMLRVAAQLEAEGKLTVSPTTLGLELKLPRKLAVPEVKIAGDHVTAEHFALLQKLMKIAEATLEVQSGAERKAS